MTNALAIDIYSNKKYVMINTIIFKLPNGSSITLDRETTEYSVSKADPYKTKYYQYLITINWKGCYIWAINGYNLWDNPTLITNYIELARLIEEAEIEIVLEEDAGSDYEVELISIDVTEA